jgi:hypothetical protein
MDKQSNYQNKLTLRYTLYIYLGVCVTLILVILFSSFDFSGGNKLHGQLYVKPNIVLNGIK